jgi:hypothetical protein
MTDRIGYTIKLSPVSFNVFVGHIEFFPRGVYVIRVVHAVYLPFRKGVRGSRPYNTPSLS